MCNYQGYEFGASYPDSTCIDGYLWDADSDDGDGMLTRGGEIACPACNTRQYLADAMEDAKDGACGSSMFRPWCAATVWEAQCAIAAKVNGMEAMNFLTSIEPFETLDWPDRAAVYAGRARWDETVPVIYRGALQVSAATNAALGAV